MELMELHDEMESINVSTTVGTSALHINLLNKGSRPAALTSRAFQLQFGLAACLALVFVLGFCYRYISSRFHKIVVKRRLASGGGASGEGDDEEEGREECYGLRNEPVEDDETELLLAVASFQQGASATQPSESGAGPSRSPEEQASHGRVAEREDSDSQEHATATPEEQSLENRMDDVRRQREVLLEAVEGINTLLEEAVDALNQDWVPESAHWPLCQALFDAVKYYLDQTSAHFNAHNQHFGLRERLVWLNRVHRSRERSHITWNAVAAFASAFGFPAPDKEIPPSDIDFRVRLWYKIIECRHTLREAIDEHREQRLAASLAKVNSAVKEASSWLELCASVRHSMPEDLLHKKLGEEADSLGGVHLEAMKAVDET